MALSSSHPQVLAALLFPCLQLKSICPVIEEKDLYLLHVLGDTSFAGSNKDLALEPFLGGLAAIALGVVSFHFK